jgi:hypothetical protein
MQFVEREVELNIMKYNSYTQVSINMKACSHCHDMFEKDDLVYCVNPLDYGTPNEEFKSYMCDECYDELIKKVEEE